ncbi:MAG: aldehyde dehydrogenase family protein, partial [Bacteroidota bacterium]
MQYRSFDPFQQHLMAEFPIDDRLDILALQKGVAVWKSCKLDQRIAYFERLADLLESECEASARLITAEMGKPIVEARQELMKSTAAIRQLNRMAPAILMDRLVATEARTSFVRPEPFGLLLAVMPWNFPIWQVLR